MNAPQQTRPVALIDGLCTIADRYDVLLCDVWGVLHDGLVAFAPASDALMRFRRKGGTVVLVSNAPRPGESRRNPTRQARRPARGLRRHRHVGRPDLAPSSRIASRRSSTISGRRATGRSSTGSTQTSGRSSAPTTSSALASTTMTRRLVEDYRSRLAAMRARNLLMVCANPDLVVERGDRLVPCAGAIALAYEEMGGEVYYAGKPHRPVYDEALRRSAALSGRDVPRRRVLAIGDADPHRHCRSRRCSASIRSSSPAASTPTSCASTRGGLFRSTCRIGFRRRRQSRKR